VKTWDVIIVGGGIIGLSLAIALRKRGAAVLVVERGEPGREASHAAGGMLVDCPIETPAALQTLATASARMYPEFAHELEIESGLKVDLRDHGTIVFPAPEHLHEQKKFTPASLLPAPLAELEPALADSNRPAFYLKERSVDPRALTAAAFKTAKNRSVDFSSGDPVTSIDLSGGHATGVTTTKTSFLAAKVVNCAGAWSGQLPFGQSASQSLPTRPVKGQMLCLAMQPRTLLKHVIRSPKAYLIPRSDGRLLVGATVEEAGFDKRTDTATIQRLHRGEDFGRLGGIAPRDARQSAHPRRDRNARLLRRHRPLPRRDPAGANYRTGHDSSNRRPGPRLRSRSVFSAEVRLVAGWLPDF
jgi:glycine oxidase